MLSLVFKIADDNGLLLLDLKDLRAMLQYVGDNAAQFKTDYGNVSAASIGAIQRGLLALENQGADKFFGEPMLDIADLMQTDAQGRGVVNILAADKLMQFAEALRDASCCGCSPSSSSTCRRSATSEKPKLVFFFDEAHLLFDDAPKALLEKIEQVVRLIRSKGVGVYFVHAEPARRARDRARPARQPRAARAARLHAEGPEGGEDGGARRCAPNPKLDAEKAITELGVGEALVSLLDEKGTPGRRRARLHRAARLARSARSRADERKKLIARLGARRALREGRRPRVGLREAEGAHRRQAVRGARDGDRQERPRPGRRAGRERRRRHAERHPVRSTGPRGGRSEGVVEAAAKSIGSEARPARHPAGRPRLDPRQRQAQ